MASNALRFRAIALYKELHRLGREYPDPSSWAYSEPHPDIHVNRYNFHRKLRGLYEKNRHLREPEEIEKALKLAEFIRDETLALYALRKYRYLKRMYPNESTSDAV